MAAKMKGILIFLSTSMAVWGNYQVNGRHIPSVIEENHAQVDDGKFTYLSAMHELIGLLCMYVYASSQLDLNSTSL